MAEKERETGAGGQDRGFALGTPRLICRWRLASKTIPLENRHLRALSQRSVEGRPVTPQLVAWAKQHIEWTLSAGAADHPDGVLMIVVDDGGRAAMTVGRYDPLEDASTASLAMRARDAAVEAEATGVSPETLWASRGGTLVMGAAPDSRPSGSSSLVSDLAGTIGIPVVRDEGLVPDVLAGSADVDEVFLVSDEHGVVCASDAGGPRGRRFSAGYDSLLQSSGRGLRR